MATGLKEHLTCPICYNVFHDPHVISVCQHTFCKMCIDSSLSIKATCPVCRVHVLNTHILPNRFIANIIGDNKLFLDANKTETVATAVLRLSITERYAPNWKPRQGVREIVQNWYDGVKEQVQQLRPQLLQGDLLGMDFKKLDIEQSTENDDGTTITKYTATCNGKKYGEIIYNHSTKVLFLTNHDVSLSRKILLLGSSNKVGKDYLVGQFGEGLKIGILALVREGRAVMMHTNAENWSFGLQHDIQYGENVLSVSVERDTDAKTLNDTSTSVFEILPEEWELFSKDFLFLTPPKEFCETINGTLLLDDIHKHKLFVKGFWICDLKDAGLIYGVNLNQMELDRDRRAVVQKHDIENKVGDIWSKAVVQRQDLIPIFFDLLMLNDEMISKAQWYINDYGVKLLSDFFLSVQGKDAQPVCNTNKDDVLLVETVLHKKAVLCPEPLYNILVKSSQIRPVDEELQSYISNANKKISISELTEAEQAILKNVFSMLKNIIDPSVFSEKHIAIYSSNFGANKGGGDFGQWKDNTAKLSRKIFDLESVHEKFNRCSSVATGVKTTTCRCVETHLLLVLCSLRAEATTTNVSMRQGMEKVMIERLLEKMMSMQLGSR